jgi:hypothetical protein
MEQQNDQPEDARRLSFKQALERANERAARRQAETLAQTAADGPALPLSPASPRAIDAARLLELEAVLPPEIRRPPLAFAPLAGLLWALCILLLFFGSFSPQTQFGQRLLYVLLLLGAGLMTFLPLQWALRLPALSWRGTTGWGLLFYTLAFVPAPAKGSWLLTLPELPVYLLLIVSVFLAASAAALPAFYMLGLRLYRLRSKRFDLSRAGRQAIEVGLFAAGLVALAAAKMLTLISMVLLLAILALGEIFILGGQVRER